MDGASYPERRKLTFSLKKNLLPVSSYYHLWYTSSTQKSQARQNSSQKMRKWSGFTFRTPSLNIQEIIPAVFFRSEGHRKQSAYKNSCTKTWSRYIHTSTLVCEIIVHTHTNKHAFPPSDSWRGIINLLIIFSDSFSTLKICLEEGSGKERCSNTQNSISDTILESFLNED